MKKALPFILVGILVLFVVLIQFYIPKPINWNATFEKRDKNPYGDYILHDFFQDIFPEKKIIVKDRTLYEVLDYYNYSEDNTNTEVTTEGTENTEIPEDEDYNIDSIRTQLDSLNSIVDSVAVQETEEEDEFQNSKIIPDVKNQNITFTEDLKNYIIINTSFSPGDADAAALLNFVRGGNCAFVAADYITGVLADSLNIQINNGSYEEDFSAEDLKTGPKKDSIYLTLLNPKLKTYNKKYWYRDGTVTSYFYSVDTANTLILGKNSKGQASFVRVQYGQGYFYLSSTSLAFTNYNMILADNSEYISACLSYLPVRDTYWDEYYKNYKEADDNSLRFVESQPPLYWAYYITIWAAIAYIVFEAKRRQRMIPIVEPPKNTTVEFVSTIGRLYFQKGNHKDIAGKKIYYFLEYIRTNFYLSTTEFDKEFIEKVASRSGVDKTKVSQLFALIHHVQRAAGISQADLLELNRRLEEFRKESSV
jgi:hypothetical protein